MNKAAKIVREVFSKIGTARHEVSAAEQDPYRLREAIQDQAGDLVDDIGDIYLPDPDGSRYESDPQRYKQDAGKAIKHMQQLASLISKARDLAKKESW